MVSPSHLFYVFNICSVPMPHSALNPSFLNTWNTFLRLQSAAWGISPLMSMTMRCASTHTLPLKKCSICSKASKATPVKAYKRNTFVKKKCSRSVPTEQFLANHRRNGTDGTDGEQNFFEKCSMLNPRPVRHKSQLNR
jgi:hypothetical protein